MERESEYQESIRPRREFRIEVSSSVNGSRSKENPLNLAIRKPSWLDSRSGGGSFFSI